MAKALRNANGQAVKVGTHAVTAGCPECCGPAPSGEFLRACVCQGYIDIPCAIPELPCVFVDKRSTVNGLTGVPLSTFANTEIVIIRIEGVCYRLFGQVFYDDGNNGPLSVPDGESRFGGPGVTIEYRDNCSEGCAEVNIGPEYFEAFPCSGCYPSAGYRFYTCASASVGYGIVYNSQLNTLLCINRDIGYTLAQINEDADAGGYELDVNNTPQQLLVWSGGGANPRLLPAQSCCYANILGDCNPIDCLQGKNWTQFGGDVDRWFPLDVCCGTVPGLTYTVSLVFNRTQVQDFGGGDTLTTTVTARVDSVVPVGGLSGGVNVNMTLTQRSQRPTQGIDITTESPATIFLEPRCCLQDHPQMPHITRFDLNSNPVPDEPGAYYSTRSLIDPDPATARRMAWVSSAFGTAFQLAYVDGTGTYSSTGNTDDSRGCNLLSFQHTESVIVGSGRTDVSINLSVTTVRDNAPPCSVDGPCSAGGWGGGLEGTMP